LTSSRFLRSVIRTAEHEQVKAGAMCSNGTHRTPILCGSDGYDSLFISSKGETYARRRAQGQAGDKPVVIDTKGDKHPQIMMRIPTARFWTFTICRQVPVSRS